jgi:hypothetical protein
VEILTRSFDTNRRIRRQAYHSLSMMVRSSVTKMCDVLMNKLSAPLHFAAIGTTHAGIRQ